MAVTAGEKIGERVRKTAELWDAMTWPQRFWAAWQALVVMEGKYESALIEIERMREELTHARVETRHADADICAAREERSELAKRVQKMIRNDLTHSQVARAVGISPNYVKRLAALAVAQEATVTR